jgi:hypothetical protein
MNRALSVAILSLLILMGSLFQTKRFVEFKSFSAEESVEYERGLFFLAPSDISFHRFQVLAFSFCSLTIVQSHFISTMPQLLSSYRISLPPPHVS